MWKKFPRESLKQPTTSTKSFQWKTSLFVVKISGRPTCLPVKWSNHWTPQKKDWTSLSSSLELCQFHLREDSRKLPASRVIDPSRPGQDLETCKSRTECRKWVISDALPKARGVFVTQGLLLEFSRICFFQSCGASSPTKTGPIPPDRKLE